MIRLGLHHLAMINSLGSTGNVSATARELGLGQSAISHRMKEAERRVGSKLFQRNGHSITLTQAGKRLLGASSTILGELETAEKYIELMSSGIDTVFRIGAACYAGFHWFPGLLDLLEQHHPNWTAEISPETSEDPASLLDSNQADIVLTSTPASRPGIKCTELVGDELVAVMSSSHPLARQGEITPEQLIEFPYVTHHTHPERGREYERIFRPQGILPKQVVSAGRTQALIEILLCGEATTILPKLTLGNQARRLDLTHRALAGVNASTAWYLLRKSRSNNSAQIDKLEDLVHEALASVAESVSSC